MNTSMTDNQFWRGRKVLLTGHTGFKGAWLQLWLRSLGADVTGYALKPATSPNLSDLVSGDARSIIGDVRDAAAVRKVVADSQPHIVIHMAAQALVRESYRDPVGTYATNVMGTVTLLEACRTAWNAWWSSPATRCTKITIAAVRSWKRIVSAVMIRTATARPAPSW